MQQPAAGDSSCWQQIQGASGMPAGSLHYLTTQALAQCLLHKLLAGAITTENHRCCCGFANQEPMSPQGLHYARSDLKLSTTKEPSICAHTSDWVVQHAGEKGCTAVHTVLQIETQRQ